MARALVLATSLGATKAAALAGEESAPGTASALAADAAPRFEEVLVTDIAQPKRPGELWLGVKPRLERRPPGATLELPLHLETGIVPDLGVELVAPGRAVFPRDGHADAGFGDLELSLKYDLVGASRRDLAVALGLEATFPSGDREPFGEGRYELGPAVLVSARLGAIETHAAVEAGFPVGSGRGDDGDRPASAELDLDVAAHWRVHEGVGLIGELTSRIAWGGEPDDASVIVGIWGEPIERVEVGLGVEVPVAPQPGRDPGVVGAFWRRF